MEKKLENCKLKLQLACNKNCQIKLDEKIKKRFFNTHKFFNHDNNEFILLLRKGVYRYEYSMIGKNSMKQCYLKKKIFTVT